MQQAEGPLPGDGGGIAVADDGDDLGMQATVLSLASHAFEGGRSDGIDAFAVDSTGQIGHFVRPDGGRFPTLDPEARAVIEDGEELHVFTLRSPVGKY